MTRTSMIKTLMCLLIIFSLQEMMDSAYARSINDSMGKTSLTWLKTVSDAEISAAGECLAARDGIAGLLVHPAAVAGITDSRVKLSYVRHYVDSQYGSIGYARKYKGRFVGIRMNYVNYGEFIRTNKQGKVEGTFTAGDIGFSVNVGKQVRDDLKIGATVSYLTSRIEEFTSRAATVDLGVLYHPPFEGLSVGAVLSNMGKVFKSYSSGYEETLPVIFTVGARKELIHSPLTLMADIIFPNDNDIVYAFGVKAAVKNTLSLYAGIKSRTDIDVQTMKAETDYSGITTFGFGISLERYRFNYACCLDDAIENIHKVTLGIRVP